MIADVLKNNPSLTTLNLNGNHIGDEELKKIDSFITRNQNIYNKVKAALESIASSDESDEPEHNIHAFDLKYYQSVNPVIFEFDDAQHNKINNYINNNFFHLAAVCNFNSLVGDAVDGKLEQTIWDDIFGYLELSDVVLDQADETEVIVALSGDDELS